MAGRGDPPQRLAPGPWVPLPVASQLVPCLRLLQRWVACHPDIDPPLALRIKLQMAELGHLIDLGEACDRHVPAERWEHAMQELERLTAWLITTR